VFVAGQSPIDPDDDHGSLPEGIEAQTRQVVENLRRVLAGAASGLDQVVFARVYLTQFEHDASMNTAYESYFAPARLPARTCIGVTALTRGALVEIDLLARERPGDRRAGPAPDDAELCEPHKLIAGCSSETSSFLMLFTRSPTAAIVKPAANGTSNLFAAAVGAVSQR
jgi:2-iminobutanoate/2-iminopropanoate deaminase